MPTPNPPVLKAPQPTKIFFDPFNSSSTGHQQHANKMSGSTSWRDSRSYKLAHQFRDTSGRGGGQHLSDLVGAGSKDWQKDGRKENGDWEVGAPGLRESGWQDIRGILSGSRKRRSGEYDDRIYIDKKRRVEGEVNKHQDVDDTQSHTQIPASREDRHSPASANDHDASDHASALPPPQIFKGLTIYLNGSTAPEVSDHRLKQLFAQHGGNASVSLGRRTVTHVILGKTCGGGLASGKIHKEVTTVGGKGIKYVTAQWVLDSVEKGKRQPEGRYMQQEVAKRIGGSGQGSVRDMFVAKTGNAGV